MTKIHHSGIVQVMDLLYKCNSCARTTNISNRRNNRHCESCKDGILHQLCNNCKKYFNATWLIEHRRKHCTDNQKEKKEVQNKNGEKKNQEYEQIREGLEKKNRECQQIREELEKKSRECQHMREESENKSREYEQTREESDKKDREESDKKDRE